MAETPRSTVAGAAVLLRIPIFRRAAVLADGEFRVVRLILAVVRDRLRNAPADPAAPVPDR